MVDDVPCSAVRAPPAIRHRCLKPPTLKPCGTSAVRTGLRHGGHCASVIQRLVQGSRGAASQFTAGANVRYCHLLALASSPRQVVVSGPRCASDRAAVLNCRRRRCSYMVGRPVNHQLLRPPDQRRAERVFGISNFPATAPAKSLRNSSVRGGVQKPTSSRRVCASATPRTTWRTCSTAWYFPGQASVDVPVPKTSRKAVRGLTAIWRFSLRGCVGLNARRLWALHPEQFRLHDLFDRTAALGLFSRLFLTALVDWATSPTGWQFVTAWRRDSLHSVPSRAASALVFFD